MVPGLLARFPREFVPGAGSCRSRRAEIDREGRRPGQRPRDVLCQSRMGPLRPLHITGGVSGRPWGAAAPQEGPCWSRTGPTRPPPFCCAPCSNQPRHRLGTFADRGAGPRSRKSEWLPKLPSRRSDPASFPLTRGVNARRAPTPPGWPPNPPARSPGTRLFKPTGYSTARSANKILTGPGWPVPYSWCSFSHPPLNPRRTGGKPGISHVPLCRAARSPGLSPVVAEGPHDGSSFAVALGPRTWYSGTTCGAVVAAEIIGRRGRVDQGVSSPVDGEMPRAHRSWWHIAAMVRRNGRAAAGLRFRSSFAQTRQRAATPISANGSS